MSLVKIAWRSIQQRRLASALTALSMGLGVALVVAVLVVYAVVNQAFHRGGEGYDLIVGPKGGGDLELVLNAVFYLREPTGTIPYSFYKEFTQGRFALDTEVAVPICMGHNYRGFQVVGTLPDMFNKLRYFGGKKYTFAEGENFRAENPFDAVLGATAARQTGLKVGGKFQARHGVGEGAPAHRQEFTVVGILAPTGTPNDRAVFVNMEGFYQIHSHEEAGHGGTPDHQHEATDPDASKAVTAILVCVDQSKPGQTLVLERQINNGRVAQAAAPSAVIAKLFEGIVGNIQLVLLLMAVLIVVVAGLGIMVSIYNSMSERRHEIAVMRALGASRLTVMFVILMESILLSLGGGALGLLLGHGLIGVAAPVIVEQTGVAVGLLQFRLVELVLIPGLIVLASLVGYLPAMTAYRTDVARSLTATP
jgi:putative ABC transport system permease protein